MPRERAEVVVVSHRASMLEICRGLLSVDSWRYPSKPAVLVLSGPQVRRRPEYEQYET